MRPILYLVIPCYNEEEVLPETHKRLKEKFTTLMKEQKISSKSRVLFCNDGSKDQTWNLITNYHQEDNLFSGLKLSRNRGHQNVLLAGLMYAKDKADIAISMDADLQDDINVIDAMLAEYQKGKDVVYGVRSSRTKDTFFKRFTAQGFYRLMKSLGVDIVYNHADCRLLSKRSLQALAEFQEVNLFLRGIVPLIGFDSSIVYYERNERFAGTSKYPLKKMLSFAFDGITSFSIKPLRLILSTGVLIIFISIVIMLYTLITKIMGNPIDSTHLLIISIWFIGGLQMLSIGIVGEYIGKIYHETKRRPRYIVEEIID